MFLEMYYTLDLSLKQGEIFPKILDLISRCWYNTYIRQKGDPIMASNLKKERIWELDVLRGICILAMVIVHLLFDLCYMYELIQLQDSRLFDFISQWGGIIFLLLSGTCVTLGSHPIRRGLIVFGSGMLVTLVTVVMVNMEMADKSMLIYFGVLHCLGICMLLWPLLKRLPLWLLPSLGIALTFAGIYIDKNVMVETHYLTWLGFMYPGFQTSDYFPLLPNLGYFVFGIYLGKTMYAEKKTLFPKVNPRFFLIRFFSLVGKLSLFIYLLHQPLIAGAIELYLKIRG